jgi:RNA polymerase sigma-70 factor, ECF subfamily
MSWAVLVQANPRPRACAPVSASLAFPPNRLGSAGNAGGAVLSVVTSRGRAARVARSAAAALRPARGDVRLQGGTNGCRNNNPGSARGADQTADNDIMRVLSTGHGVAPAAAMAAATNAEHGRDRLTAEVTKHVAALRRYALVLVADPQEADDLVQESLSRVLAHMRAWRPIRDLRAYLFSTMHNVFIDSTRKRHNRADHIPIEDVMATLSLPANQPRRLECRDLLQALAALPEQQREVVLLVGLEGMSYLEAARVLDVPVGTIMSRLSRGREALRQLMTHGAVARLRVVK